jgi:hypothetical protein
MLYDLWHLDLVFLLPKNQLLEQPGVHFSPQHWAPKRGKQCGRPVHDASDEKCGALNSDAASRAAESHYGAIHHPTIVDLVLMILDFEDAMSQQLGPDFDLTEVVLFKNDLKRAFMLLNFRAEDAPLLAAELTDELCVMYHTGLFGLGTMPYAFGVISRVLCRHINLHITGSCEVYVDDVLSVTLLRFLESDNRLVVEYDDAASRG